MALRVGGKAVSKLCHQGHGGHIPFHVSSNYAAAKILVSPSSQNSHELIIFINKKGVFPKHFHIYYGFWLAHETLYNLPVRKPGLIHVYLI